MKKLMIALAVAAIAAIGNAAVVNWGSDAMSEPSGAVANKSVTGYLFVLTADQYNALNTAYGAGTSASAGTMNRSSLWNSGTVLSGHRGTYQSSRGNRPPP